MNVLTPLLTHIYAAMDTVSRENVGFLPAVSTDNTAARAMVGQTIRSPIATPETATDITAAQLPPDDGDNEPDYVDMVLTHARRVPVKINGEEQAGLNSGGGAGADTFLSGRFAQAFRTLTNEMESTIAAQYIGASRATGTAGTTPFEEKSTGGRGIGDAAFLRKILIDNGAPRSDLRMVIDSTSGANMRSLGILTKENEAGTDMAARTGALLDISGFCIGETGASATVEHTAGDAAGYLVNGALAIGATAVVVDTGSGSFNAGDVITIAGDANQYVVESFAGDTVTIAKPGLRQAAADDAAITVAADYSANVGFARSAIQLATRAPALPTVNGQPRDSAIDRTTVTDPFSGVSFEVSVYEGYRQVQYEIAAVWGSKIIKPEHMGLLLG